MKVSSLVCCSDIRNDSQGQDVLSNPLQMFNLVNIPSTFSFSLSVGLVDVLENDVVRICIKNEQGEQINEIGPINIPPFPSTVNKEMPVGMQLNLNVQNMIFNSEGLHTVEVIYHDECLLKTYIRVQRVSQI